jgi:hypothetical protein
VLVGGEDGTFTMYDGEISENTAPDGGGVHVNENGTFTMYDGEISGNEASTGGGVFVGENGTFTMDDGEISGNEAFAGGGVWIGDNGTASMRGGEISGNTTGDGVFVAYDGAFTMSGGARVTDSVCLHHTGSSNSSIAIGGTFTGPAGAVAKIDLYKETNPATSWSGAEILKLAADYSGSDGLPTLRSRFTLGSFISGSASSPEFTLITGYGIGADGTLQ